MDDEERLRRLTAPGYLADLDDADAARVRAMRDECSVAEQRLSFVRRVLQGHLDLALAEIARRRGEQPAPLVARVTDALTGPAGGAGPARAVGIYAPAAADEIDLGGAAALPDMDDADLGALVDRLRARERALSDRRGVLLDHLDRLQDALVARYREDRGAIDDVASALGGL